MNKITDKVNTMDTKINGLEARMANIEQSRDYDSKSVDSLQTKQTKIDELVKEMRKLEEQQKEKLLELQSREMRDNLIFYRILEERGETDQSELRVENARDIRFHRVHRLGRFNRNKTRPIVAKFAFFPERKKVRKSVKILKTQIILLGNNFQRKFWSGENGLGPSRSRLKPMGRTHIFLWTSYTLMAFSIQRHPKEHLDLHPCPVEGR